MPEFRVAKSAPSALFQLQISPSSAPSSASSVHRRPSSLLLEQSQVRTLQLHHLMEQSIPVEVVNKAPSLSDDRPAIASDPGMGTGKSSFSGGVQIGNNGSKTTPTCAECGKTFLSNKALFGHLRCHPNRNYRGAYPPPIPPKKRQLDARDSAASMPFPPASMGPMAKRGRKLGAADESEDIEEALQLKTARILLVMANIAWAESKETKQLMNVNGLKSDEKRIKLQGGFKELEQPNEPGPSTACSARYECNVCLKSFSSHQALGGHKASHSKAKSSHCEETTNIERMNEGPDLSVKPVTDPASSSHSPETSRRPLEFDLNELPPLEGEEC